MTDKRNAADAEISAEFSANLRKLYQESGEVEPESGLDRIIRARAEQATSAHRGRRRMPWLGGLVTASVAAVAIVVVVQLPPPGSHSPEAESSRPFADSDQAAPQSDSMGRRSRSLSPSTSAALLAPQPASESVALTEALRDRESEDSMAGEARTFQLTENNPNAVKPKTPEISAHEMVATIRALLAHNEIESAREWAQQLAQKHPSHVLPEDLSARLSDPSADSPESPPK